MIDVYLMHVTMIKIHLLFNLILFISCFTHFNYYCALNHIPKLPFA